MRVLLAITGSIAAYKAAVLTRLLVKNGHQVRVVMTRSAKDFITPLTLATLSGNAIVVENFDPENGAWNSHISLGEWAQVMLIAPATANTLAKMACGVADNLLLCTYLSARCPVWVAPAMDLDMYAHPATQANIGKLRAIGVGVIEPGEGFLASGLIGKGRMAEPEEIVSALEQGQQRDFQDVKVLITAGASVEKIDPVRFISNFSTGKMGFALAEQFLQRGAKVTVVCGHTTVGRISSDIHVVRALSADDMLKGVRDNFSQSDIVIFAAAVADYTPAEPAQHKIKHDGQSLSLKLRPTIDIAAEMGKIKSEKQMTVGFALETENGLANGRKKLMSKNLDAIVVNSLEDCGAGFGVDTNKVTIISPTQTLEFPLRSKVDVACDIIDYIANQRC